MIGVVGPADSVALLVKVAEEMGLREGLIPRSYQEPDEAPDLARDIDDACSVILFTGRVPFELTRARARMAATLDYVPHSGVDLYRALLQLARRFDGQLPSISIDTIDAFVVRENYEDIGETPPDHIYALDPFLRGEIDVGAIADFHARLHASGDVQVCLTCLSSVSAELERRGVPVLRVGHTSEAVRDSLQRAALTSQLRHSTASQVGAISIRKPGDVEGLETTRSAIADVEALVQGRSTDMQAAVHTIVTTRGAVDRELNRRAEFHRLLARLADAGAWVGIGFGTSLPHAEEQARYALAIAATSREHCLVLADGSSTRLSDGASLGIRIRELDGRLRDAARQAGVGTITFARLRAALASLGSSRVTAKELASAYGVEPRSARRLLSALIKAGLASPTGAQSAPHTGRPQLIYEINVQALLDPPAGLYESC